MPSPFPGMDPYLEGYLWPDVHHALATKIRQQLAPKLKPRYVARLEIYGVDDENPEAELGIMYPDVEILTARRLQEPPPIPLASPPVASPPTTIAAPLTIPLIPVQIPVVEIRDAQQNELVTSIEILSPVNKREPGLAQYRQKRRRLREAGVHLLEIDLLRRGIRPFSHRRIPQDACYLVILMRANQHKAEVWPIRLPEPLPIVPVPLRPPDPDVLLELSAALQNVYDEAVYELSIDYSQPPPLPTPSEDDQQWLKRLLNNL